MRIFVSYSHEDVWARDKLLRHAKWLEASGMARIFSDTQIRAGENWRMRLEAELADADLVVFLVSRNFIGSKICLLDEMQAAIRAGKQVFPILIGHCDSEALPLGDCQFLPLDENERPKAIELWGNEDEQEIPWGDVAKALRQTWQARGLAEAPAEFLADTHKNLPRAGSGSSGSVGDGRSEGPPEFDPAEPHRNIQFAMLSPVEFQVDDVQELKIFAFEQKIRDQILDLAMKLQRQDRNLNLSYPDTTYIVDSNPILTFVLEIKNCRVLNKTFSVCFDRSWISESFYFSIDERIANEFFDGIIKGKVWIFSFGILISELSFSSYVYGRNIRDSALRSSHHSSRALARRRYNTDLNEGRIFRKIFASYSSKDKLVVDVAKSVAGAIGDVLIVDKDILRGGEEWSKRLDSEIRQADRFQLFWSDNSKISHNVEREWRLALSLARDEFIVPVSWQKPAPERPVELNHLHFADISIICSGEAGLLSEGS